MTTQYPSRYGFNVSRRVSDCSDGRHQVAIRAVNPLTGQLLRYADMDQLLKARSDSPNSYVQVTATSDSDAALAPLTQKLEGKLFLLCARYYQAIFRSLPSALPDTASAFWQLYKEDYCKWDKVSPATQTQHIWDIEYYVLPVLDNYSLHQFNAQDCRKAESTLCRSHKKSPLSPARKNELLRRMRHFLTFIHLQNCCAYSPEADYSPAAIGTDPTAPPRLITKNARPVGLTDTERQRLFHYAIQHPDEAISLCICGSYDGLSAADLTLLRFGDLHTTACSDHRILTATIPDTGKDAQPISRIRRVPLSWMTSICLQARMEYWISTGLSLSAIEQMPLVSSRRKNAAAYPCAKIRQLLTDALAEIARLTSTEITETYYKKDGTRAERRKTLPITDKLLIEDVKNILRSKTGLSREQADAVLGIAQKSTDGRHYYDLYCDDSMATIYKKLSRFWGLLYKDMPPQAALIWDENGCIRLGTSGSCHFSLQLERGDWFELYSDTNVQLTVLPEGELPRLAKEGCADA